MIHVKEGDAAGVWEMTEASSITDKVGGCWLMALLQTGCREDVRAIGIRCDVGP